MTIREGTHKYTSASSPLSFTVAEAQVLCYELFVGLNCAVVVFGTPDSPVGAEEGVMIHTRPPQVLTSLGAGQKQRNLTILSLPLQHEQVRLLFSFEK